MVSTSDLIRYLAMQAAPVRRLRPPLIRAGIWLAWAVVVLSAVALSFGIRPELGAKLSDPAFIIEVSAATLTGIAATIAAFHLCLPDRSPWWLALPMPILAVWLSTIGYGCLTNWVLLGPAGLVSGKCIGTIALASTPLALVLLFMLRSARFIRPMETALAGALAVAGLTVAALRFFHDLDSTALVLIWNVAAGFVIVGVIASLGPRLFRAKLFAVPIQRQAPQ